MIDDIAGSRLDHVMSKSIKNSSIHGSSLFLLFLSSTLWTVILTIVPVMVEVPSMRYYNNKPSWYCGNDVFRLLEPIGGTIFAILLFMHSGVFKKDFLESRLDSSIILLFGLALGVFNQGAGFHSASNMYKHVLESIMQHHDDTQVADAYYYMRTIWEHIVSHYMYASGYAFIALCFVLVYRNHVLVNMVGVEEDSRISHRIFLDSPNSKFENIVILRAGHYTNLLLISAAFLNGLLIASVAVEFISGCAVGIIYTLGYGMGVLCIALVYDIKSDLSFYAYVDALEDKLISSCENSKAGEAESSNLGGKKFELINNSFTLVADETTSKNVMHKNQNNSAALQESAPMVSDFDKNCNTTTNSGSSSASLSASFYKFFRMFKRRAVVYYFILSYFIGFCLIILWIIIAGGMRTRAEAGI